MTTFDYNYQNSLRFCFVIEICQSRWGLKNNSPNLHKKTTNWRILVVVVKWCHRAIVLFRFRLLNFGSDDGTGNCRFVIMEFETEYWRRSPLICLKVVPEANLTISHCVNFLRPGRSHLNETVCQVSSPGRYAFPRYKREKFCCYGPFRGKNNTCHDLLVWNKRLKSHFLSQNIEPSRA